MATEKLQTIPKPSEGERTVMVMTDGNPLLVGSGDVSWLCGECGALLLKDLEPNQELNIVIGCFNCGKFNDAP